MQTFFPDKSLPNNLLALSQLSNNQDLPSVAAPATPEVPAVKPVVNAKSITPSEYTDHIQLSVAQLETVALMLQVLEQTDGGPAPTE